MSKKTKYLLIVQLAVFIQLFYACEKDKNVNKTETEKLNFFEKIFSKNDENASIELSPVDFLLWCENSENGLIKTKEIGEFKFSAFYKPISYLAISELKNDDNINQKKIDEKTNEYGDLTYFSFKIENTKNQDELIKLNLNSEAEYFYRIEYLSFKMQKDFKLIIDKDTINCELYHHERVFGLAPFATFVLGFPVKLNDKNDIKLCYHDETFKNGIIILNFKNNNISNLPKIKI